MGPNHNHEKPPEDIIYLKNHIIGKVKIACEKLLKKSNIKYLQIWRPFNLIGNYENQLSDHFHNLLINIAY